MISHEERVNSSGDIFSVVLRRNLARTGFSDAVICNTCVSKLVNVNEGTDFVAVHAQ